MKRLWTGRRNVRPAERAACVENALGRWRWSAEAPARSRMSSVEE